MKLSSAILLGDTLRTRNGGVFLEKDSAGSYCGCAIGGGLLAEGWSQWCADLCNFPWPWLNAKEPYVTRETRNPYECEISRQFIGVCNGGQTLEQLVDYVRSVEPECGECNSFVCTCPKPEVVAETTEVACA